MKVRSNQILLYFIHRYNNLFQQFNWIKHTGQIPHFNALYYKYQLAPQSPVHIVEEELMEPVEVESSDDDIIFVEAVAAPTRTPR